MKHRQPKNALKLAARDAEDLGIISTITQDAIVHPKGMAFQTDTNQFHMLANRLCWEHLLNASDVPSSDTASVDRIHSSIHFDHVEKAEFAGFNPHETSKPLSLLSIQFKEPYVHLNFADQQKIRLTVKKVQAKIQDVSESWPAGKMPRHWHSE